MKIFAMFVGGAIGYTVAVIPALFLIHGFGFDPFITGTFVGIFTLTGVRMGEAAVKEKQ